MIEKGQALALVVIVIGAVFITILLLIAGAQVYYVTTNYSVAAEQATAIAEAGVDKALISLNASAGAFTGENGVFLGEGYYDVKILTRDTSTKIIESTGFVPNKTNPKSTKTVRVEVSQGTGVSFKYGIQVGEGGLNMGNSNLVKGSLYSNGNVSMAGGNTIEGEVWVAGGPQPNPDQQTPDCVTCVDFIFGKTVSGEDRFDVAQSFRPQSSGLLNKISLKVYKVGNPTNVTVRILSDSNGSPNKNGVLADGTLYAGLVTGNYAFIDVTFNTSPTLTQDTAYWIMMDTFSDGQNYWSWQDDLIDSYQRGAAKYSDNWNKGNPTWNPISYDLSFRTYMGGAPTSVRATGQNNRVIKVTSGPGSGQGGHVHANTVENLYIEGDAYYQTISGSTVVGISNPGSADPAPKVFPISDANIAEWKGQAAQNSLSFSGCSPGMVLGPGKITTDVSLGSNCTITVRSPVWITGDFSGESNNLLTLSSEYGAGSGVIMVDGKVNFNTLNRILGSGAGNSILMVLSTFDSRVNDETAITLGNNGNTGVFYAGTGIIEPGNSNQYKELTAWGIKLVQNSTIDYEQGLSSTLFSSGPSGSYNLVSGTYQDVKMR